MTQLVLTGSVLLFIYLAFFFSQLILFLICYGTVFAFTYRPVLRALRIRASVLTGSVSRP